MFIVLLLTQLRARETCNSSARVTPSGGETAGAQASDLTTSPPNVQPHPQAELVVAGGEAADRIAHAMLSVVPGLKGWSAPSGGQPTAPVGTGMPGPDVMIALRDLWEGVAK